MDIILVGAIINMNGYAVFVPIMVMFLAKFEDVDLGSSQVTLFILSIVTSIAAAGVPQAHRTVFEFGGLSAGLVPSVSSRCSSLSLLRLNT